MGEKHQRILHEKPLYHCLGALWSGGVTGPYFLKIDKAVIVSGIHYRQITFAFFRFELNNIKLDVISTAWFEN